MKLRAIESYLPERIMSSTELSDEINSKSSEHWLAANALERLTGVMERRVSGPDEHPSDLATYAADRALATCGLPPDEIDTIIFASVSQDLYEPATSNIVASKLGLSSTTRAMVSALAEEQAVLAGDVRFTRRQAREALGWGDTQLKVHLNRLADMEFLICHRPTGPGPFAFELAWTPPAAGAGTRFLPGLVQINANDAESCGYDNGGSGQEALRSGDSRAVVGPVSGAGRGDQEPLFPLQDKPNSVPGDVASMNSASGAGGQDTVVVEVATAAAEAGIG